MNKVDLEALFERLDDWRDDVREYIEELEIRIYNLENDNEELEEENEELRTEFIIWKTITKNLKKKTKN